jgi:hypothetical protein
LPSRRVEKVVGYPPLSEVRGDVPLARAVTLAEFVDTYLERHAAHREWAPAIEIYDLRSTFASNALAAGVSVFELARVVGTSVAMIERHYGTLIEGAGADIARRLSALRRARSGTPRALGQDRASATWQISVIPLYS